jgi:hypothetical protein
MSSDHSRKGRTCTTPKRTSTKRTFQDFVGAGSAVRATEIDLQELGPEWLEAILQNLNQQFGLTLRLTDGIFEQLKEQLRIVAGGVEAHADLITRKELETRLKKLKGHVGSAVELLTPVRLGTMQRGDFELIMLLSEVVGERHGGMTAAEARDQLDTILKVLEALDDHCERAQAKLASLPAKTGRPALDFYDGFVALMVEVAAKLELSITTAWDPADDHNATPFTLLVYSVEAVLPREAWSNSLAACAKRIERSLKRYDKTRLQNDPFCRVNAEWDLGSPLWTALPPH